MWDNFTPQLIMDYTRCALVLMVVAVSGYAVINQIVLPPWWERAFEGVIIFYITAEVPGWIAKARGK